MPTEKPRIDRLIAILTQLQSRRWTTAQRLAQYYQVSLRTIYRDIRTLQASGIPIIAQVGKGYSILEGYHLPPTMLSESEMQALVTAQQLLHRQNDTSLTQAYEAALTKIRALLRSQQQTKSELLEERLQIRRASALTNSSAYLIELQTAITNFQLVELNYIDATQNSSKRIVEPFALYHSKTDWLLVAFCRTRNAFRAFRLDRMQNIQSLNCAFKPHQITLQDYFEACRKKNNFNTDIKLSPPVSKFVAHSSQKTSFMQLQTVEKEAFHIIGIKIRTTNAEGQATQDIPAFWKRFMEEQWMEKIPNKIEPYPYAVYTNYESDHNHPYDMILGCRVSSLEEIPAGMIGQSFDKQQYTRFIAKGNLNQNIVYNTWLDIWKTPLKRSYTVDFERYGPEAQNMENAAVDIFISTKA